MALEAMMVAVEVVVVEAVETQEMAAKAAMAAVPAAAAEVAASAAALAQYVRRDGRRALHGRLSSRTPRSTLSLEVELCSL